MGGITRLTVHELEGAPRHAEQVAGDIPLERGGGWPWILSDMKSSLETGKSIAGRAGSKGDPARAGLHCLPGGKPDVGLTRTADRPQEIRRIRG